MRTLLRYFVISLIVLFFASWIPLAWWLTRPEMVSAESSFRIQAYRPQFVSLGLETDLEQDFDIYRATQVASVKSSQVINAALTNVGFGLSDTFLVEEEYPTIWLEENLEVYFDGDSELMVIALRGPEDLSQDLVTIVKAISSSYLDEVVDRERIDRVKMMDALRASKRRLREEIRERWNEYLQMKRDLGADDPTQQNVLYEQLLAKLEEKQKIELQQRKLQLDFQHWHSRHNNPDWQEQQIEKQVRADPNIKAMHRELLKLQAQLRDARIRLQVTTTNKMQNKQEEPDSQKSQQYDQPDELTADKEGLPIGSEQVEPVQFPNMIVEDKQPLADTVLKPTTEELAVAGYETLRLEKLVELKEQQIEKASKELSEHVEHRISTSVDIEQVFRTEDYRRRMAVYITRLQQLNDGYELFGSDGETRRELGIVDLQRELELRKVESAEMIVRRRDLELLQQTYDELFRKVESWDLESQAAPRIQLFEPAHVADE